MKHEKPKIDDLEAFLIDDSLSKKDAIRELRLQGVGIDALLDRVKRVVREGYSSQLRQAAQQDSSFRTAAPGFLAHLATMSRDVMLGIFERVANGEFGTEYRTAALARCRNKDARTLGDDELRSWLEDIGEVLGEPGE
jgi:hypothetical protein